MPLGRGRIPTMAHPGRGRGVTKCRQHGTGAEAADSPPVVMARAGLLFDVTKLADDITVRLRRQLK